MKIKKISLIILLVFILNLFMIPFTFAISEKIGIDPTDDILQSKSSGLNALEYWLGNFYFDENDPPYATDLFDKHTELFDIVDGPDCVDVIEYGIDNDDIYIIVENIIDYVNIGYFTIGILIFYNSTYDRESIIWIGEINIYNSTISENNYAAIFNEGRDSEEVETGSVNIDISTNTYKLDFDNSWITETDVEVIADNIYGVIFGVSMTGSFYGNITQYNLDMIPNGYYGQVEEVEEETTIKLTDTILFTIVVLAFLILIFIIIAYYNKGRNNRGTKRVGRKY
ncbi:hypothetical protein LCGC14_0597160 [marine sediment metagenome]|uniref:Uncharacterized protein n=1 Tax=marine sediment metagenome TaxID=412755 RepID=A0A0F9UK67_9ZZZZ